MQIACPACNVEYDVPDARLRPGRMVRCARCSHEWEPTIPEPLPELHLTESEQGFGAGWERGSADASPAGSAALVAPAPDKRLRAAWIATGVVFVLLFGSAIMWRNAVMTGWPASQRLYGLIGVRPAAPSVPVPGKTANAAPPAAHH